MDKWPGQDGACCHNARLVSNHQTITAAELGIRTVSIFTHEDRLSSHRYKLDEAYQVGQDDDPLKSYLDIETIIDGGAT